MIKHLLHATEYGPAMIEHIILEAKLDPNMKVATDFDSSEGKLVYDQVCTRISLLTIKTN